MREDDWSFFEEDQFKETLAAYEKMVEKGMSAYLEPEDLTDIAEYYMIHNRREEAMACIDYALSIHPSAVDPMVFLARQSLFDGDTKKARDICNAISDPLDHEVIFLKAEILIREERTDEAFDFLWKNYVDCEEAADLFLNDCIDICYDYYFYEKGLEWAEALSERHPDYAEGKMVLADMLILNGKNDEALQILNQELDKSPYNMKAWLMVTDALCGKAQYAEALDATEYALAIDSKEEHAMLVKANCLFHLNRLEEAHKQYEAYEQLYPSDDNGLYLDSICLTNMERYKDAERQLEKALEKDHTRSGLGGQICVQYTYVLSKLGEMEKALDMLDRADEFASPDEVFEKNALRGHVFLENNREKEAYKEFRKAVEDSTDPISTWLTIAISLCEAQYYTESVNILTHIESQLTEEQYSLAVPYMAYCLYHLEQWDKFVHYLPLAIKEGREATEFLFAPIFPDTQPEHYLDKALQVISGLKPSDV